MSELMEKIKIYKKGEIVNMKEFMTANKWRIDK